MSENWFIFPLIFNGFWKPRVDYKITEKSFLGAILRYGGSKEEAPPSHHGSKVLISMDLPSMFVCLFVFKMDFKVHADRYCNEVESKFRC